MASSWPTNRLYEHPEDIAAAVSSSATTMVDRTCRVMLTDYHPAPPPPPPLRPPPKPPKPPPNPPPPPPPRPPPKPPPNGPTPLFHPLHPPPPQPPNRRRRLVRPRALRTMKRMKSARITLPPEPTSGARSRSGLTPCSTTFRPCAMRATMRDVPASSPGP